MTDIVIRIGGEGGEGVISCGELLTTALARSSYEVFTFRTYPAEIKGGHAMFQVRTGEGPILSQGLHADILITFNEEAFRLQGRAIKPGGLLIYDASQYQPQGNFETYAVPLEEIALGITNSKVGKNIVALGVLSRLLGISSELLEPLLKDKYAKKGEDIPFKNSEALRAGIKFVDEHPFKFSLPNFKARKSDYKRVVMSGNEAASLGAIATGCRYFAGYPITPASEILEFMESELPKFGGAVVQTEDEIAAVASVVGASYAGKKALTATSGPGLSLMVEILGLASMSEIPAVIIDAQRGGPSTGLPTKTEQGDLNLAVFGAHGDAARIVLAPGDVEECLYYIMQAFNLAESYQTPVIFLTDQSLAHRTQTFPWPDFKRVPVVNRLLPTEAGLKEYRRFAVTPSGISPMAIPGMSGGAYAATGLEHTERGAPTSSPEFHEKMTAKRARKIAGAAGEPGFTARFGPKKAKIGVIGWGSTQGALREGVELAAADGISASLLQLKMVCPLPENDIRDFLGSVEKVIVAELNHSGQLNNMIRSKFLIDTIALNKCEGLPFFAEEVLEKIREASLTSSPRV
jgi:2-oxoglutarate ferredoxin oxidoreductase subunit alpha